MMFIYPECKLKDFENEIKKDLGKYFIIDKPTQSEKTYLFDKFEDKCGCLYRDKSEVLFKFRIKPEYSNVFNFPTDCFYIGLSKYFIKLFILFPTEDWFTFVRLSYIDKDKNKLIERYVSLEYNLKDLDITYNGFRKRKVTNVIRYYIDTGEIEIYNTRKLIDRLSVSKEESDNFLKFYEFFFKHFSKKRKNIFSNTIPFLLYIGSKIFYLFDYLYDICKIEKNLIVIPRNEINKIIENLEDTKKILKEKFRYNVGRVADLDNKETYICIYKNVNILKNINKNRILYPIENLIEIYPLVIEVENKKEEKLFKDILKETFMDVFDNSKHLPYVVLYSFSRFVKMLKNMDIKKDEKKYYLKLYYILKYVVWNVLFSYAIFCDYALNNSTRKEIEDNTFLFKQLIKYYNHVDFVLPEEGKKMPFETFKEFVLNQDYLYKVSRVLFNWDYNGYLFERVYNFIDFVRQIIKKIAGNKLISLSEIVLLLKIKPKMFKEYVSKTIKHYNSFPICIEKGKINIDNVDLYIFEIRYCEKAY